MKKIIWIIAIVVLSAAGYAFLKKEKAPEGPIYSFETIENGDLESIISSTGTLNPVNTVEVGTQVSGIVLEIYVDFNDIVKKGQLVAKIDDTFLKASLQDSEANLDRVRAQRELARVDFERVTNLYNEKISTEQEFLTKKYSYDQAIANMKSARSARERAKTNLAFTNIYSPINGIVVSRNVSVGQTVAASMSAPTLFVIAEDMSKMEIIANVDESDIGKISEGQKARFTVQAYEDEFDGEVRQVRLLPTSSENVVNYKVVVRVTNPDGKLLPGMTATVDFLIETASDVLTVSNTALRFKANDFLLQKIEDFRLASLPDSVREMMAEIQKIREDGGELTEEMRAQMGSLRRSRGGFGGPGGGGQRGGQGGFGGQGGQGGRGGRGGFQDRVATLYYIDSLGNPGSIRVFKGITDGQRTQIRGRNLQEGQEIIKAYANPFTATSNSDQSTINPFAPNNSNQRRGPRGI